MDISNSTDLDTKFKVTGGGGSSSSSTLRFTPEAAVSWPTLPAGSRLSVLPKSTGPWTVYFVVEGRGIVVREISSADGQLTLMRSGSGFHVRVS